MIEELRTRLNFGICRNIVVFDIDAATGNITRKLIWDILRYAPECNTLYAPKDVFVEFVPDSWTGFHEGIKMFGVNVIFSDHMPELQAYYEEQGSLASQDQYLLLATISPIMTPSLLFVNETNTVIASC